ncbi:MAG TPA: class I SAM-dependent methyltransferase [Aggregatilineaceae bacterium]|jgi:SAM-dependent methyltransferase|nr:class I SAM-dependent methyltransferase [Aggregatilineaceae bacterium]
MNPPTERYHTTRREWERIWSEASVEGELNALKQRRTADQLGVFPAYLPKNGYVLEAGSGLGATLIYLRDLGFKMIGLDYAENALHACRAYDSTLSLQVGDVHALPYCDQSLHGYLSFGVLEHFEHGMGPALREANRVLVDGGVLVLTIPYPNVVHRLVHLKRRLLRQSLLTDDGFYESTYTQHDLKRQVEQTGFEVMLARPTSHSFTLWGLGWPFRGTGYYQTTQLADTLAAVLCLIAPWPFNFTTLLIARKARNISGPKA